MNLNDYQTESRKTAIYPGQRGGMEAISYVVLGLVGEAGEIANKVKKVLRDDNGILSPKNEVALTEELGDVLWYVAQMATELGVSLEAVVGINLMKLNKRKETGTIGGDGDHRGQVDFCNWCPDPEHPSPEHHPNNQVEHVSYPVTF